MSTTTHEYRSVFARRYYGDGEADAVLAVLDARGIEVPDEYRERIASRRDLDQLMTWLTIEAADDDGDTIAALDLPIAGTVSG